MLTSLSLITAFVASGGAGKFIKPPSEAERKRIVKAWHDEYEDEQIRLETRIDKLNASGARTDAAFWKDRLLELRKDKFTVLPPLSATTRHIKDSTLERQEFIAKEGDFGPLKPASGVILRSDGNGTLVAVEVTIRAAKTEPMPVYLMPPLPFPSPKKKVAIAGLWRAAGVFTIDGKKTAAFYRVEVKPEDLK